MSNHKKNIITEKHIESIADQTVRLIFPIFGNLQANISGKIVGRIRNRFKQFVFTPTFPFMTLNFSSGDVEKIEITDGGIVITLEKTDESKKRRKKKKKEAPVVASEPDIAIDLTNKSSEMVPTSTFSPSL